MWLNAIDCVERFDPEMTIVCVECDVKLYMHSHKLTHALTGNVVRNATTKFHHNILVSIVTFRFQAIRFGMVVMPPTSIGRGVMK